MIRKRRLTSAAGLSLLALCLLPGLAAQGQSFAVGGTAVMPTINHKDKVITFNVRLLLYPHCSGSQSICQITPKDVGHITKRITDVWNRGYTFSCYDVRVNIEVTVGTGLGGAGGMVGIKIDQSPGTLESKEHFVKTVENSTTKWSSDDPNDRLIPENNPDSPSTWGWPAPTDVDVLAHEFGHILGLDDTYQKDAQGKIVRDADGNPIDTPGAPHDIMNGGMYDGAGVSQETINRLVRRHGLEAKLQCDGTITQDEAVDTDTTTVTGHVHFRLEQHGTRSVSVFLRSGQYRASMDVRGTTTNTQTQHLTDAAGRPCTVISKGLTTYWGSGTGSAQVRIKDTVYVPATRASRARGGRDTDYRIDVTLPPMETTVTEKHSTVNGCGRAGLGNPESAEPDKPKWPEWTFTIEGHRQENAKTLAGDCAKTVKTNDVGDPRLQLDAGLCFRFPTLGNRKELWLMRHTPAATSYLDGSDIPFRVRTTWNIGSSP